VTSRERRRRIISINTVIMGHIRVLAEDKRRHIKSIEIAEPDMSDGLTISIRAIPRAKAV